MISVWLGTLGALNVTRTQKVTPQVYQKVCPKSIDDLNVNHGCTASSTWSLGKVLVSKACTLTFTHKSHTTFLCGAYKVHSKKV